MSELVSASLSLSARASFSTHNEFNAESCQLRFDFGNVRISGTSRGFVGATANYYRLGQEVRIPEVFWRYRSDDGVTFDGGVRLLDIDDLRWSGRSDISQRCARLIDLILEVRHAGSPDIRRAGTTTLRHSNENVSASAHRLSRCERNRIESEPG